MRPYSPSGRLNSFPAALERHVAALTPSLHRLQLGLPGYLIRFAPQLSSLTVERVLADSLRHWWSSWDYRISPLPQEYRRPLPPPSRAVSPAGQRFIAGFNRGLAQPATDASGSINVPTTRRAGITAAADTRLALSLFPQLSILGKSHPQQMALGMAPSSFRLLRSFRDCCAP